MRAPRRPIPAPVPRPASIRAALRAGTDKDRWGLPLWGDSSYWSGTTSVMGGAPGGVPTRWTGEPKIMFWAPLGCCSQAASIRTPSAQIVGHTAARWRVHTAAAKWAWRCCFWPRVPTRSAPSSATPLPRRKSLAGRPDTAPVGGPSRGAAL